MKRLVLAACLTLPTAVPADPAPPADAAAARAQADRRLAMRHYRGDGVARDAGKAVALLERAAARDVEAAIILGKMFEFGMGVPVDEARAAHWYVRGAELGDQSAQYSACIVYYKGLGVARDPIEAIKWCTLARAQGGSQAEGMEAGVQSAEAKLTPAEVEEGRRRAAAWQRAHPR